MSTASWSTLADALRMRYPDDWAERYASYRDGSNSDLRTWRNIGGEPYAPSPNLPSKGRVALEARNRRIVSAARTGTPIGLIAERFGLSTASISAVLASFGERAIR